MGPRMSASCSIYWLWLPCVTLTLLLNTGLFAFLRLLAKWGVIIFKKGESFQLTGTFGEMWRGQPWRATLQPFQEAEPGYQLSGATLAAWPIFTDISKIYKQHFK